MILQLSLFSFHIMPSKEIAVVSLLMHSCLLFFMETCCNLIDNWSYSEL